MCVDALTVTLTHFDTKEQEQQFHHAHVCMPFAGKYYRKDIFPDEDWNFFLILIAREWRAQLEKLEQYRLMNTPPAQMRWEVLHHKRTILDVLGEQFVLANCASDRAAVVLKWTRDASAADAEWRELGHFYFAMGLPHQHPHQSVALAVCKGLFVAKALSQALVQKRWWSPPLVISWAGGDHDEKLQELWAVSEPQIRARDRERDLLCEWREVHKVLTGQTVLWRRYSVEKFASGIKLWLWWPMNLLTARCSRGCCF